MKPYHIGIIGAGMYGKMLMRRLQQDDRAHIAWVNSASEATTRAAAEEFGVERWTLDYHEVLADPAVARSGWILRSSGGKVESINSPSAPASRQSSKPSSEITVGALPRSRLRP